MTTVKHRSGQKICTLNKKKKKHGHTIGYRKYIDGLHKHVMDVLFVCLFVFLEDAITLKNNVLFLIQNR